jgi:putative transposase
MPGNVELLREAFRSIRDRHPFTIEAFVLLPDHLHCIWTLPQGDCDFSTRWRLIKSQFTRNCMVGDRLPVSASRSSKGEQPIWQRRFWEHLIRNDEDFRRHVDYIHYNPVKHGLVRNASEWPYSSFGR